MIDVFTHPKGQPIYRPDLHSLRDERAGGSDKVIQGCAIEPGGKGGRREVEVVLHRFDQYGGELVHVITTDESETYTTKLAHALMTRPMGLLTISPCWMMIIGGG